MLYKSALSIYQLPDKADSKHWDTTQNIYIEADNLEALKCLRNAYAGKIKMIYIDPPYNTGNDFIYPDDFHGKKVTSNEAGKHTKWLNMMYPRLMLARELLSEDGVIVCSIDSKEHSNLVRVMNEIFGENNYIDSIIWQKKSSAKGVPPKNMLVNVHEYLVVYSKGKSYKFIGEERDLSQFKNPDNDPRGPWRESNIKSTTKSPEEAFTITDPNTGKEYTNTWAFSKDSLEQMIKENRILWKKRLPKQKEYYYEMTNENKAIKSSWGVFDAQSTTVLLRELIPEAHFDNPKPLSLMQHIIDVTCDKNDIILDLFSGSATTAHAVMLGNTNSQNYRKYIMVQLSELLDVNNSSIDTISKYGMTRILRAGNTLRNNDPRLDIGFRVFRVGESNIPKWWKVGKDAKQLELFENNVKQETESERNDRYRAICYEIMLKHKCLLSAHVDEYLTPKAMEETGGKPLFVVDGGLFICTVGGVNEAWAQAIVKLYESKYKLPPMEELNKDNSWTVIVNDDVTANAMDNADTRDSDMNRAASTLKEAGLSKGKFMYI